MGVITALYVGVELFAANQYPRISKIEARIMAEYGDVRGLPAERLGKPTLLMVGNSLPLSAVDMGVLGRQLPGQDVHRFLVEGTTYLDWYFGLRRLFEQGCEVRTVVVSMSTDHLRSSTFQRPNYFARYLMQVPDLVDVKAAAELDNTTTSTLFLAHWSPWLARQSGIRGGILKRLVPNLDKVGTHLTTGPAQPPDATVEAIFSERLRQLKELGDAHQARIIVVLPPRLDRFDHSRLLLAAGAATGVPVVMPYAPGEMPAERFPDRIHVDQQGSELFTPRLAKQLRGELASPSSSFRGAEKSVQVRHGYLEGTR